LNDSRSPVLLSRAMQLSVVAAVVSLHPLLYDHLLTIVQVLVIDARNVQPMCKLLPRLLSNVSTATKTIMLAIVKILGPVSVPSQRHVVSAIQKRTSATSVINVRQRLVVTAIKRVTRVLTVPTVLQLFVVAVMSLVILRAIMSPPQFRLVATAARPSISCANATSQSMNPKYSASIAMPWAIVHLFVQNRKTIAACVARIAASRDIVLSDAQRCHARRSRRILLHPSLKR